MLRLKRLVEEVRFVNTGNHQQQYYNLILEALQKRRSGHLATFEKHFKAHKEHVQSRNLRVLKYGHPQVLSASTSTAEGIGLNSVQAIGNGTDVAGPSLGSGTVRSYAMFSVGSVVPPSGAKSSATDTIPFGMMSVAHCSSTTSSSTSSNNSSNSATGNSKQQELRRRLPGMAGAPLQQQHQHQHQLLTKPAMRNDTMLRNAQNVEKSLAQMGELFAQMATLITQQSETITRIEDDVEIGLTQTTEAHDSMQKFYEITKGNRSMIIKVFLLLIFLIFLFLVWT